MLSRIRDALRIVWALAGAGLALGAGPVQAGESVPTPQRSALEALLWPTPTSLRRDQDGHSFSAGRLGDRVVVVSFLTTGCGIVCVIRLRDLADLERSLPGPLRSRVAVLAVTLDPVRDRPPALRAFADGLGLDTTRVTLVDNDPDTAARQRAALRYPPDRSEPPDTVLIFDRIGQLAMSYGATPIDRPRLEHDIAELDRFARGVGHPATAPAL